MFQQWLALLLKLFAHLGVNLEKVIFAQDRSLWKSMGYV